MCVRRPNQKSSASCIARHCFLSPIHQSANLPDSSLHLYLPNIIAIAHLLRTSLRPHCSTPFIGIPTVKQQPNYLSSDLHTHSLSLTHRNAQMSVSRKRAFALTDSPLSQPSKRHLNNALAAELQTLRISRSSQKFNPAQHQNHQNNGAFGPTLPTSPFLYHSPTTSRSTSSSPHQSTQSPFSFSVPPDSQHLHFNQADFAASLPFSFDSSSSAARTPSQDVMTDASQQAPIVTSPPSSSSAGSSPASSTSSLDMGFEESPFKSKRSARRLNSSFSPLPKRRRRSYMDNKNNMTDVFNNHINDDVIVEEIDDSEPEPDSGKQLVVYRPPPVQSPDQCSDLVKWSPTSQMCNSLTRPVSLLQEVADLRPPKVIPMPWTDKPLRAESNTDMDIDMSSPTQSIETVDIRDHQANPDVKRLTWMGT